VGKQQRRQFLASVHKRYRRAGRRDRAKLLDQFCEDSGYHRKYAIRLLNGPPPDPAPRKRRPRGVFYGKKVVQVLIEIWTASGYPWSVRLKALLPTWLPRLRDRHGLTPKIEAQILKISARQIDRRLKDHKRKAKKRLYGRTKPGTLLKHQIPIKTEHWDVKTPGFGEVDLVSHSGSKADGDFIHSLNLTDILTTWVETRAVMGKGQAGVVAAIDDIRRNLPFTLVGVDSDNGSEFVNHHLLEYCSKHGIQLTRGRPYKKDDNAHIEQKNWTHVRKLLGYVRYDTDNALTAINQLYKGDLRLLQNLFLPSVKLLKKERVGSKVRRHYDQARTPLDRVMECSGIDSAMVAMFKQLRDRLDPFLLSASVDRQIERIYELASNARASTARVEAPAPIATGAVDADVPAAIMEKPRRENGLPAQLSHNRLENRERKRFPTGTRKTLRVSHSAHRPLRLLVSFSGRRGLTLGLHSQMA
jgi:hypothetical protein